MAAYRTLFLDLFKGRFDDAGRPAQYLSYPEALLKSLAEVYGLYHMKLRVGGLRIDPCRMPSALRPYRSPFADQRIPNDTVGR